jgi:HlyD family secretion protein
VRSARAQADAARAAERAAAASADALVLLAPSAGVVVARHAEPGEILPAGQPAVTLGDPTRPWVRVYVSPDAFPFLEVGDTASAVLDALPGRPVVGRVTALATRAEFTPRVALTESERADLLFGVRVEFEDTTGLLKAGLPVTVRLPGAAERRRLAAREAGGGG